MTAQLSPLIEWYDDEQGLPAFRCLRGTPVRDLDAAGQPAAYGEDPYVLLGNEALTLFAHWSGALQLLSGQRGWARLNFGGTPNRGENTATLTLDGQKISLLGHAQTRAEFGVGFGVWRTETGGIRITRRLCCDAGYVPRVQFHVCLENLRNDGVAVGYAESLTAGYAPISWQRQPRDSWPVPYTVKGVPEQKELRFEPGEPRFALDPGREGCLSPHDTDPPRMWVEGAGTFVTEDQLGARTEWQLGPGETQTLSWTLGFTHARKPASATPVAWTARIPDFLEASDPEIRRELRWHVACLEAMNTWSDVYGECFIPQGCSYDYDLGITCSRRDLIQHGMAALVWRPALARSILRHCLQSITPQGELRLMEDGGGASTTTWFFQTSDQQLYLFWFMARYLLSTGDTDFLQETVPSYPPGQAGTVTVLTQLERAFSWLVHQVGFGPNGLLRLLCSDWNDCIYFFQKHKAYPDIFMTAESTLNAAMAVYVCGELARALPETEDCVPLRDSLNGLAAKQHAVLEPLWQGRSFLPRAFIEGRPWGGEDLFLEPQIFALLNPAWTPERKQALWHEIRSRVLDGEALGPRQRETPPDTERFPPGNRENGGVWFALNGPLALAVAAFAPEDAREVFERMTLAHHRRTYPGQWPGQWSGSDNHESSLRCTRGMPDPQWIWSEMPIYCAHAHAWPLMAWQAVQDAL